MAAAVACFLCASISLNCSRVLTIVRTLHDTTWIEQFRVLSQFYSNMGSNNISKVTACSSQNFKSVLCVLKQKICFKQLFCCSENIMWEKNTFKLEIPVWNQEISNDSGKCFPSEKQSLVVIMSHIHGFSTFHDATKKNNKNKNKKTHNNNNKKPFFQLCKISCGQSVRGQFLQYSKWWIRFFTGCETQKYPTNGEFSV